MRGAGAVAAGVETDRAARGTGGAVTAAGRLLCLLAGGCDLATGVVLVAAPSLVLPLLGTPLSAGAAATVYVRYVGAFVAAVGAAYLYPFLLARRLPSAGALTRRLPTVVEVTALVRTAVALFVAGAVAAGELGPLWLAVTAVDGGVAALQVRMLARGAFGRG